MFSIPGKSSFREIKNKSTILHNFHLSFLSDTTFFSQAGYFTTNKMRKTMKVPVLNTKLYEQIYFYHGIKTIQ